MQKPSTTPHIREPCRFSFESFSDLFQLPVESLLRQMVEKLFLAAEMIYQGGGFHAAPDTVLRAIVQQR